MIHTIGPARQPFSPVAIPGARSKHALDQASRRRRAAPGAAGREGLSGRRLSTYGAYSSASRTSIIPPQRLRAYQAYAAYVNLGALARQQTRA